MQPGCSGGSVCGFNKTFAYMIRTELGMTVHDSFRCDIYPALFVTDRQNQLFRPVTHVGYAYNTHSAV